MPMLEVVMNKNGEETSVKVDDVTLKTALCQILHLNDINLDNLASFQVCLTMISRNEWCINLDYELHQK